MSLRDDLIRINDSLSSTLHGINSLLPFEVENLKNTPPVIEEAIGSARREGEESGYSTGYNEGRENAETIIVDISNEAIEKYTTPAEDWSELPSKIDEVYEAGKAAGGGGGGDDYYDTFWDAFQHNGSRTDYTYAFSRWDETIFSPKYDLRGTMNSAFYSFNRDAADWESFDMVQHLDRLGVVLDTSVSSQLTSSFMWAYIGRLGVIDCTGTTSNTLTTTFAYGKIKTIDKMIVKKEHVYNNTFINQSALVNITFEGVIANSISFQWSPKLSKASIQSIYAALTTEGGASANTITLSLTAVNKAFETSEGANDGSTSAEWQNLVSSTPWRTVLS